MSEPITPEISRRICQHMNEDHADALVLYATAFAHLSEVAQAKMLSIDPEGMDLQAEVNGSTQPVRVHFDHHLQDAEDAHHTLIAMLRQARG
jgi:putative heme iron utilization protein